MRLLPSLALAILALPSFGFAQGSVGDIHKVKHDYQVRSDMKRVRAS